MRLALIGLVGLTCLAIAQTAGTARWTMQTSGVTARLRGVSAVSDQVAWASGANGTILRTADGGRTWQRLTIPDGEALDFRDVDAIDARTAYALSIGPGEASRIYKTVDAGATWTRQFVNADPKAFFDAMAFWNAERGVAISDSVDGQFVILLTRDAGRTWTRASASGLPPALANEGAFAASGTNVAVHGADRVWIGTGAASTARVLRSQDGGRTWTVATTPIPAGPSSGIFSIAFRDARNGVIVGGDYKNEGGAVDNVAFTSDGGATWTLAKPRGLSGFRSVVAYVPSADARRPSLRALVAVGPSGADYSVDDGRSWQPIECPGFHAFSVAPGVGRSGDRTAANAAARDDTATGRPIGWGVGEQGRIARLDGLTQPK